MVFLLPVLLSQIRTTLENQDICLAVTVAENREFSPQQFVLKLRVLLVNKYQLQIRLYVNKSHIDYAYQVFSDEPTFRWDNKEEYPSLMSYPHHFHTIEGEVVTSSLSGNPLMDLPIVLSVIRQYLEANQPGG